MQSIPQGEVLGTSKKLGYIGVMLLMLSNNFIVEAVPQVDRPVANQGGGFFSGGPSEPDRPELSFVEPRFPETQASEYVNTSDMISAVEA